MAKRKLLLPDNDQDFIKQTLEEIMRKRYEILEDFCEAYLAIELPRDGNPLNAIKEILNKIELVEKHDNNGEIRWYFQTKGEKENES